MALLERTTSTQKEKKNVLGEAQPLSGCNRSVGQEMTHLSWQPKVYYRLTLSIVRAIMH
jgi:hypothetical protein